MEQKSAAKIEVRVQPNANRSEITGIEDGILHLRIAALPVKGKANRELIEFVSNALSISKTSITIERGFNSKKKLIAVEGLTREQALQRLQGLMLNR